MMMSYQWSHASSLWLVTPASGNLASDFIVELKDVLNCLCITDTSASDAVAQGVQVVGALVADALIK